MATSYPDRTNARGIWRITDITRNIKTEGTFPTSGRTRGLFTGGEAPGVQNTIDYVTIHTTGNATDFGDLSAAKGGVPSASSFTRALYGGGHTGADAEVNVIDYVTIATTGNASDFGDLTAIMSFRGDSGVSNSVRGIYASGNSVPGISNVIEYNTIATLGNATDFGDLSAAKYYVCGMSSPTRGVFAGGFNPNVNVIEFIEISTTGNAVDFGDCLSNMWGMGGTSNFTRGILSGGKSPSETNVIQSVTMASTGNSINFGDLTAAREQGGSSSNLTRGVHGGGTTPSNSDVIDYITIASAGDSTDFGDLTQARKQPSGCSNGHGGLQAFDPVPRFEYIPGSGRSLYCGGDDGTSGRTFIDLIHIPTLGNASDFGDLLQGASNGAAIGSNLIKSVSYGGYAGGSSPYHTNVIQQTFFATQGNSSDFGDTVFLGYGRHYSTTGNTTRGVFVGGYVADSPHIQDAIDYITFATTGNGTDFGNLTGVTQSPGGVCSNTRACYGGGNTPSATDKIDYITIASTGDASDFGDLTESRGALSGVSSSVRGVFGGGNPTTNTMDYITIASTGDASDFGDLVQSRREPMGSSNTTRGVYHGGKTPTKSDTCDYITIASTGNAADFGDLTRAISGGNAASDSHGGLQA